MSKLFGLLLLLLTFVQLACGQASPTATRSPIFILFKHRDIPTLPGNFEYSVSASESFISGYYGQNGTALFSNFSGNLSFLSSSDKRPLSIIYSGGYLGSNTNQPSSAFQALAVSQVVVTKNWDFVASDSVSYLPQTPTSGLAGVPGLGDMGNTPVQTGDPGQGILTGFASRVNNTAQGSILHRFNGSTSVQGFGSFLMQRFVGDSSGLDIDNNQITGSLGANHRIDARNSINANATYSRYTYIGHEVGFTTEGINFGYTRQWNRRLSVSIAGGPQRTSSSSISAGDSDFPSASLFAGSTTGLAANVALNYAGKATNGSLTYTRGVNNGSGVIEGGIADSLRLDARRSVGHNWNVSAQVAYARNASLPTIAILPFSTNTMIGGVQASRAISRTLFAYTSYVIQRQTLAGTPQTTNVFSGISNDVTAGITYSPGAFHRRDR